MHFSLKSGEQDCQELTSEKGEAEDALPVTGKDCRLQFQISSFEECAVVSFAMLFYKFVTGRKEKFSKKFKKK